MEINPHEPKTTPKQAPVDEQVTIEPYQGPLTDVPDEASLVAHPTQQVDAKADEVPFSSQLLAQGPSRRLLPREAPAAILGFICGIAGVFCASSNSPIYRNG